MTCTSTAMLYDTSTVKEWRGVGHKEDANVLQHSLAVDAKHRSGSQACFVTSSTFSQHLVHWKQSLFGVDFPNYNFWVQ